MNDRLMLVGMLAQGDFAAQGEDTGEWANGTHQDVIDARCRLFLRFADALLSAAGEQEDCGAKFKELRHDFNECVAANSEYETANADLLARAEAAEARASALQAKLDEAARLARETAGEAAMLMRRMETLTEAELRMVNCGVGEAITMSEIKAVLEVADEIKRGRK